ncbi:MAG: TAXI family TRAP transporter solute-binding subunit [Proteobacteria bacterium]|nr:TAXI family TRAP transporter solute-binding subunit [Pseudomonadota bacterium]
MKKTLLAIIVTFVSVTFAGSAFAAKYKYVTIGTGGVTGVYYPTGGAIAKMVNVKKKQYGIRATVESTGGSVFNINAILAGDLEFGIAQSDRGYQAWYGVADWKKAGKQTKLRSVFSIHPESITLVVAAKSGIKNCKDLKGKRVSVGAPGSGTRKNSIDALSTCGLTLKDLGTVEGLKSAEGSKMIQDDRIDGFFFTVGHPNGSIKESAAGRIKVQFVPFTNTGSLLDKYSYYANAAIPVSSYPGVKNSSDVATFGVKATLVTSADVSEDVVYAVTKEVFENFDRFKKLHPAYANLKKEQMLEGLTAPIHKGALKYYKEAGLMK